MKPEKLLLELESICEKIGFTIRKERGSFRGDRCVMEGENLIVINQNQPPEARVATLAKVLRDRTPDEIYIKPAVRKELQQVWKRLDRFREPGEGGSGGDSNE